MRKVIGLVGTISLFGFVYYLFHTGKINLVDFYTGLAISLVLSILALLSWTFKPELDRFSEKRKKSLEIDKQNKEMVQRTIGKPNKIDNGIQHYDTREDLPKFNELINSATETVDMSAITYTIMILHHSNVIKKALKKGIKFTFLLLDKDSDEVDKYIQVLENAKDLKHHIISSIESLCDIKRELKDKDNLLIKTYDSFERKGMIIIDKNKDGLIKVEEYNFDNPINRRNKIAYKIDKPDFYQTCVNEYTELLEKSKDYVC